MLKFLKKILPHSLFHRFLLIILLPNIIVQLVSVYVFYERHWSEVNKRMFTSIASEIHMIVLGLENTYGENRQNFIDITRNSLDLGLQILPDTKVSGNDTPEKLNLNLLQEELKTKLTNKKFAIDIEGSNNRIILVQVQLDKDVVQISIPRRSLYTPTTYIFILWMMGSAVIFVLIAILFMRTQVRFIAKLAEVAEQFGKGQDIPNFKPSGATEVRQASQAFIVMKERINRQVQQRTEMLAGVSHDLKTPLTRMKLQLALMQQSPEIEELQADILEMEKMVQEYLDFAKGKERVVDANVSISDMLRSIAAGYRNLNKKIDVNAQNGVALHINSNSLRRAITNIVDNALKYGTNVWISSSASKKYAYIKVDDDGPGIEEAKRTSVFQPFFRLDSARNLDKGGTGLGLAIARDIIVSYGGEITLETSHQNGLRVVIKLPL